MYIRMVADGNTIIPKYIILIFRIVFFSFSYVDCSM